MAASAQIAASYLHDIELDRRMPSEHVAQRLVHLLALATAPMRIAHGWAIVRPDGLLMFTADSACVYANRKDASAKRIRGAGERVVRVEIRELRRG